MKEKKNKKIKKIGLYLFYGALTVCILVTILSFNDMGEIFRVLGGADYRYVLIAFALLMAYALLYPLTTCILAKSQKLKIGFGTTYTIAMTEHFFNGITPFATGGQPFQVYAFTKAKIKAADSTGLLMMNFITFMMVTNTYALLSLIYYSKFVTNVQMSVLAIVGFTINFSVLVFLIALATSRKLRNGLVGILRLLSKIRFLKKFIEPKIPMLTEYFDQTQAAFKGLFKKVGTFILCFFVKAVTMALYYAITFYIMRALHIEVGYNELFFVMCGTSFAITMVVFMPTPGSSGGIEFAFKSVFASIAGGALGAVSYGGMLLWRLLSYYFMMLLSLFFYIGLEIYFKTRARKERACVAQSPADGFPDDLIEETENGETASVETQIGEEVATVNETLSAPVPAEPPQEEKQ